MTITLVCGLQDEARIFRGAPGLQVLCGAAQRDMLSGLAAHDCRAIVSAGCAGALAPDLRIGALVMANSVVVPDGELHVPPLDWRAAVVGQAQAQARRFFSAPTEQAATPREKEALYLKFGAHVVDEESWAVAQVARARGLPWLVLRAISDAADQTILPDDDKAQRPDGSEDIGPVIGDALRDPAEALREAEGFGRSLDALRAAFRILGPTFGLPVVIAIVYALLVAGDARADFRKSARLSDVRTTERIELCILEHWSRVTPYPLLRALRCRLRYGR